MLIRPLIIGSLHIALVAAAPSPVTAIKCEGTVRTFGLEAAGTVAEDARLYVLNDERRALMRHNAGLGLYEDLCDAAAGCRLDYGSEVIALSTSQPRSSRFVLLNRTKGAIVQIESEKHAASVFEGTCTRTQLAKPQATAQF